MSAIFEPRSPSNGERGSGGKIRRKRGNGVHGASPYRRPEASCDVHEKKPSWLSRFANGAGKFLSSAFLGRETGSPSSSSSSDSEEKYEEENEAADSGDFVESKPDEIFSEAMENLDTASLVVPFMGEAKTTIVKLIQQETFSRSEYINLTRILKSRVVDSSHVLHEGEDATHQEFHDASGLKSLFFSGTNHLPYHMRNSSVVSPRRVNDFGSGTPKSLARDLENTAVMEAKKWVEEKKLESSPGQNLGPCTLNTTPLPIVTEVGQCSPVDVAKSYMKFRPAWASPSASDIGYGTPSPIGSHQFVGHTPYPIGDSPLLSSKASKRYSLAIDASLNEIRRVRLKSKEIAALPSANQLVSRTLGSEAISSTADKEVGEAGLSHDSASLQAEKPTIQSNDQANELAVNNSNLGPVVGLSNENIIEGNFNSMDVIHDQKMDQDTAENCSDLEHRMEGESHMPLCTTVGYQDSAIPEMETEDPDKAHHTKEQELKYASSFDKSITQNSTSLQHDEAVTQSGKEQLKETNIAASNGFNSSPSSSSAPSLSREGHDPLLVSNDGVSPLSSTAQVCQLSSETTLEVPLDDQNSSLLSKTDKASQLAVGVELPQAQLQNLTEHTGIGAGNASQLAVEAELPQAQEQNLTERTGSEAGKRVRGGKKAPSRYRRGGVKRWRG
ncbi:uncharacterized protein LOC18435567 isoform X2 [Amborella trichopoda]|uniref:uncharacterized protein LOC18435567 isoform X2 n=1 Tax=Amborella trichopoda TaxID=13333 RepID=UPI0009BE3E57|nr:uncharacterized protein LOC18435567 isoform X2 [Amborella trichopoda]|eukprot:XP_020523651.1 uncharacterized protein LOC18435567 isoform X2 [Amborella trichopoda]